MCDRAIAWTDRSVQAEGRMEFLSCVILGAVQVKCLRLRERIINIDSLRLQKANSVCSWFGCVWLRILAQSARVATSQRVATYTGVAIVGERAMQCWLYAVRVASTRCCVC